MDGWTDVWNNTKMGRCVWTGGYLEAKKNSLDRWVYNNCFLYSLLSHLSTVWLESSVVRWVTYIEKAHVHGEVLTIIQLPSSAARIWKVLLIWNEFDKHVYIYDTKARCISHLSLHPSSFSCRSFLSLGWHTRYWLFLRIRGCFMKEYNSAGKWLNGAWLCVNTSYVCQDVMPSHKAEST
jgi:hypothetical protein